MVYAVQHEMCETPEDFIARRTRLAFLDTQACSEALPKVGGCGACGMWVWMDVDVCRCGCGCGCECVCLQCSLGGVACCVQGVVAGRRALVGGCGVVQAAVSC